MKVVRCGMPVLSGHVGTQPSATGVQCRMLLIARNGWPNAGFQQTSGLSPFRLLSPRIGFLATWMMEIYDGCCSGMVLKVFGN